MSSIQALATQAGVAAYAATKGAVLSLTRVMALDHGKDNIRVTAICPGTIDTPLARANARHWNPADPAAVLAEWGAKHALKRIGQPIEVARLAAFLISEEFELHHRFLSPGRRRPARLVLSELPTSHRRRATMKRSEINRLQREALALFAEYRFSLPPFARWSEAEWRADSGGRRLLPRPSDGLGPHRFRLGPVRRARPRHLLRAERTAGRRRRKALRREAARRPREARKRRSIRTGSRWRTSSSAAAAI